MSIAGGKQKSTVMAVDLILKKAPHHAVCCKVLNLLAQAGFRYIDFALAEAYRVIYIIEGPN